MPATILDGRTIASEIKQVVARQVQALRAGDIQPGLAILLAGDNPASQLYAGNKIKACEALGIHHEMFHLPPACNTGDVWKVIAQLNQRADIDGIIIELPLPPSVERDAVLLAVDPRKDVDGFHPVNVGLLATWRPGLVPCTASGIMELLHRARVPIEGAEAVVVGRSDVVGKPAAMLLLNANATVTLCHSHSRDLARICRHADILVAAAGRPGMIRREWVKPGATVIDVGINKVSDPVVFRDLFAGDAVREEHFRTHGWVWAGDVHPGVAQVAGALTPVPGGVGPLTVAMLMVNTLNACKMRRGTPAHAMAEEKNPC